MFYRPDEPDGERGAGGELVVSLGGHPPPLLRTADGSIRPIGRAGTLLGLIDPVLHDDHVRFEPGSTLLAYTDGLTDAARGRALGLDDLHASLATSSDVEEVADDIRRRRAARHGGGNDDTAVLVVSVDLVGPQLAVPGEAPAAPATVA